ncbi:iron-binding protein [Alphaproteobacteria bacterium]|nr:iron-binding protein [Alphaproteobacteria bacterium]
MAAPKRKKNSEYFIKITKDGPYLVFGRPRLVAETIVVDADGQSLDYARTDVFRVKGDDSDGSFCLCRCGRTRSAPMCDGSHAHAGFDGSTTAPFAPIEDGAQALEGPDLTLLDNPHYCAGARFCDPNGSVWTLVEAGGPEAARRAVAQACRCPGGRLVLLDKKGNRIEPPFPPEIAAVEDGGLKISGPLWVRGRIRVEDEDGRSWEVRNRQALCRCGGSGNKPFCNGNHARTGWKAARSG